MALAGKCSALHQIGQLSEAQETGLGRAERTDFMPALDRYCRKRVHGVGAVPATEEKIPLSPPRVELAGDRNLILSDRYIISTKIDFFDSIDPERT